MSETNHASEAAASSPENLIRVKLEQAIDQLTGIVRRHAAGPNALDRFPPSLADIEKAKGAIRHLVDGQIDEQRQQRHKIEAAEREFRRLNGLAWPGAIDSAMRAAIDRIFELAEHCPPPAAEIEKMRAELATAKDDEKRLRDEKRDQIAATVEHLRRAGIIVGSPTAGPTPGVAIGEPMTLASTIGMLCDERAKILAGLGREAKALLEASFMLSCAGGGRPLPAPRVEETFGIFEALRKVVAERDALAFDRDAWKHKADTLGGDLNRIRSLVPTASDEQTTFDAVHAYLAKVHKERDASSKAMFDVAIALEEADGGRSGTYENGPPRIRAIAAERDTLRKAIDAADREFLRAGVVPFDGSKVPVDVAMRQLADEVAGLRSTGIRDAVMAFDGFLRRCGINVSKLEGVLPVPWVIAAAKLLQKGATAYEPALAAEAQTAIAAMRDVGPELAKAGIQVGPRLSHAEAIAQLRGERDRWREKCEASHQLVDEAARFEGAVVADLATHGFFAAGGLGGVRFAVGKALTELARLRKESKRDQVAKQQALIDEIARLLPGKGPLLERVKHAAKMVEQDAIAERLCKELDLNPEKVWLEAMRKSQPKRDVALAPIKGFVDEAIRKVVERAGKDGGLPSFGDPFGLFARHSCKEPKVAPATGQPRTEAPAGATLVDGAGVRIPLVETDGSVDIAEDLRGPHERCTVTMDPTGKKVVGFKTRMDLGDRFRESMDFADPDFFAITALLNGETHDQSRHRHLHTAVAELAKVVESIGARLCERGESVG